MLDDDSSDDSIDDNIFDKKTLQIRKHFVSCDLDEDESFEDHIRNRQRAQQSHQQPALQSAPSTEEESEPESESKVTEHEQVEHNESIAIANGHKRQHSDSYEEIQVVNIDSGDDNDDHHSHQQHNHHRYKTRSRPTSNKVAYVEIESDDECQPGENSFQSTIDLKPSIQSAVILTNDEKHDELDGDREYNLLVHCRGQIHRIKTTRLSRLPIKLLAETLGINEARLLLTLEDKPVSLSDSPESLGLKITDILNATEMLEGDHTFTHPDSITLVLQDGLQKNPEKLTFLRTQPMLELKKLYASKRSIHPTQVSLEYDGDLVDDDTTPADLDMDNEDIVDVKIVAK